MPAVWHVGVMVWKARTVGSVLLRICGPSSALTTASRAAKRKKKRPENFMVS